MAGQLPRGETVFRRWQRTPLSKINLQLQSGLVAVKIPSIDSSIFCAKNIEGPAMILIQPSRGLGMSGRRGRA